ncbi:ABC transporter substrate-binding protein [Thermosulfuriphilus ammonigenes]|uniref:ABC transporter substrate-binding protein n=1 Tax=Thermosulfuriphilus ammonigenes TaxID=1936021 RepID=A0A6G7PXV0_9BACT|nr:ABC transporter substrate-binding protein [Thermosulfuriphilus ammonigenes]QIJ72233.1 ABC transporter substrate-binding protein [Thermosulfuriphilus ammonigenes]
MAWFLAFIFLFAAPVWGTPAHAAPPIKIGAILDLSGPGFRKGQIYQFMAQKAVETVNQRGGIRGRPLKLIVVDDQGLVRRSLILAQRLISAEGVVALIGPSNPRAEMALRRLADREKIPLILISGDGPLFRQPAQPFTYNFKVGPALPPAVKALYRYLKSQGFQKIGLLLPSSRSGKKALIWLRAYAAEFHLKVVAREWFSPGDTDVETQLRHLDSQGAQAIVSWAEPKALATVVNSWQGKGLPPLFLGYQAASLSFTPRLLPPEVKATWPRFVLQPEDLDGRFLLALKELGRPPEYFSATAWDAIMLLAKGLNRSGANKKALRWVLENLDTIELISGTYRLDRNDHYGLRPESFIITGLIEGNLVR